MRGNIVKFLKSYSTDPFLVDRLIISAFVRYNELKIDKNTLLKSYLISQESELEYLKLREFMKIFRQENCAFFFEELIELFEFVVSPKDRIINGAVYTPEPITDYIVNESFEKLIKCHANIEQAKFGDISCGCGGFLFTIAEKLHELTKKSFADIFNENLFGLDIESYCVQRTKLVLSLLAIFNGEDLEHFTFNIFRGNALNFNWFEKCSKIRKAIGFTAILGNPPYVTSRNISTESKKYLKNWVVTKSGHPDLYLPFFEIGLKYLQDNGILGYISMNTFIKSINGRELRRLLGAERLPIKIIDFRGEQIFRRRSTYTCICILQKAGGGDILYTQARSKEIAELSEASFEKISYDDLDFKRGWQLSSRNLISKIEKVGKPLGSLFKIRNGFATLCNEVYVFKPDSITKTHYVVHRKGIKYEIEKNICKPTIKPNILKDEKEIDIHKEQLIFPYTIEKSEPTQTDLFGNRQEHEVKLKIMTESYLKNRFPKTYRYLLAHKALLSKRDKGNRKYEKWYAFGRKQSLTHKGYKLLFPYISDSPRFIFSSEKELFFYNGFAIFSDDKDKLLALKKILESKIFYSYVVNSSKPYSNSYFSLGKNYIKNFGVIDLSEEVQEILLNGHSEIEIEKFLLQEYDLTPSDL